MKSLFTFIKRSFCVSLALVLVIESNVFNSYSVEVKPDIFEVSNILEEVPESIDVENNDDTSINDESNNQENNSTEDIADTENEADTEDEETESDEQTDASEVSDENSEESTDVLDEPQTVDGLTDETEEDILDIPDEIIMDKGEIEALSETEGDVILIHTAEELVSISMDGKYELANDIDLSGYSEETWKNLGSSSAPFKGTFDGKNHAIYNIPKDGVWQELKGATIHNLVLRAVPEKTISSSGLLCYKETDSNINQCFAEGSILGRDRVGLLIGYADGGTISQCQAQGRVEGNGYSLYGSCSAYIGGLVGYGYSTRINDCVVLADVSCNMWSYGCYASGICSGEYVNNSIFIGTIRGVSRYDIGKSCSNCYFVEENSYSNYYPITRKGKAVLISDLRNSDTLSKFDFENIWECQSDKNAGICSLRWLDDITYSDGNYVSLRIQGFSETDSTFLSNRFDSYVYFDRNIVVKNSDVAYLKKNDTQQVYTCKIDDINGNYFHVLAEDLEPGGYALYFKKDYISDENGISASEDIYGYTFTISNCGLSGTGTEDDPYQIKTIEQLNNMYHQPDKSYILLNDIDADTVDSIQTVGLKRNGSAGFWYDYDDNRIGGEASPFSGVFDGNGHVIRNVRGFSGSPKSARTYYYGLFAGMDNAVVKNLNIDLSEDFFINADKGDYYYVGIITGEGTGVIQNCSVSGNIKGNFKEKNINAVNSTRAEIGWIAGEFSGTIEECATIGEVSISSELYQNHTGGLVCNLNENGVLRNCYSYVEGAYGGLVCNNYSGSIIDLSYYSGVSPIVYKNYGAIGNSVYYDAGKRTVSEFGTPLNSDQMVNPNSYVNFDFKNIWACEPYETPYLQGLGHYILPGLKRPYDIVVPDDSLSSSYMSFYTKNILNGLTYGDLFTKYPEYLENNPYSSIEARLISAAIEAENSNSDSQNAVASWFFSLKKGVNFFVDELAADIGLKKDDYEQFKYDLAYELILRQMTETDKFGPVNVLENDVSIINEKISFLNSTGYEITNDVLADVYYSSFQPIFGDISTAREYVTKYTDKGFEEANTLNKYIGNTEKILAMVTLLSIYQMESESIDNLIEVQKRAGNTELVEVLEEISAKRKKDPISYIGEHYLKEVVLEKMGSFLPKILDVGTGTMAVTLGTQLMGNILPKLYESNNASVDSIVKTLIMHQYWQSSDRVCSKYICDFILGDVSERKIREYETAYSFRLECMKLWFEEAQGCTSDPVLTNRLSYSEMIGKEITYENYLRCCLNAVDADIKSGKLVVKEDEIVRKDSKGVVIDENYNNVEAIQKKITDIEEKYVPNNDIQWEDNWEGQTGNLGFTRMVFEYVFGCDMPNAVDENKQYEFLENGNVVLVGQLANEGIDETGIKLLFENIQVGDIVQGYSQEEGIFSAIVEAFDEDGISLLECSDDDNTIICNEWGWFDLSSRVESESENCGISIYRTSNYLLLPNEKKVSESDDDFVIEGTILKSYKGSGNIVIIPEGVTEIGSGCFKYNTNIVSVSFPGSLLVIDESAFKDCTNLSGELVFPLSLKKIGNYAFYNCPGLTGDLSIPSNVESIGTQAFTNCNGFGGKLIVNSENAVFEMNSFPDTGKFTEIINKSSNAISLDVVEGRCWLEEETGNVLTDSMSNGSVKLVRSTVTVHFDVNGECDGIDDILISLGDKIGELPEPVIPGSLFLGWYTHKDGGVKISEDLIPQGDSIVVYARWQEDVGDITGEDFDEYCENGMPTEYWVAGLDDSGYEYTGSNICPQVKVYYGKDLLEINKDYSVKYQNNKYVGTAKIVITGKANYCNSSEWEFSIIPKNLNNGSQLSDGFEISVSDKKYTGKLNVSKPQVKFNKMTLREGKDYTLSYSDNQIDIGDVGFTINGIGNYTGSYTSSYRIFEKTLDFSKIYVESIPTQTYSGEKIEISADKIMVYSDKSKQNLLSSEDYSVSYVNNLNVGTATMIVSGTGDYSDYGKSKKVTFKIVSKKMNTPIVKFSSEIGTSEEIVYTGKKVTPKVIVRDPDTWKIIDSSNYSLKYVNNVNAADETAKKHPYVEIKMKKNYSGQSSIPFSISPRPIEEGQADITVNNMADKGTPINVAKLVVKVVCDGKVLKRNTDYLVNYEEDDNVIQTARIEYIGNYSGNDGKNFKKYKDICNLNSDNIVIELGETEYTYSGEKVCPSVSVKENNAEMEYEYQLVAGKDYSISYSNNVNVNSVGTKKKPTWKITGKGAYKGVVEGYFDILPRNINEIDYSVNIKDMKYTGKELKPSVEIKNIHTGKALKKGKDFTIEYAENIMPEGEGNVPRVYILGIGNYSTSEFTDRKLVKQFRIYEKDISKVYVEPIDSYTYSGKQNKPQNVIVYSDKYRTTLLSEGTDYLIEYGNNINVGYGKVYLIGTGEYGGKKDVKFLIKPKWL